MAEADSGDFCFLSTRRAVFLIRDNPENSQNNRRPSTHTEHL